MTLAGVGHAHCLPVTLNNRIVLAVGKVLLYHTFFVIPIRKIVIRAHWSDPCGIRKHDPGSRKKPLENSNGFSLQCSHRLRLDDLFHIFL